MINEIVSALSQLLPGGCRFFQSQESLTLLELSRHLNAAGPAPSATAAAAVLRQIETVYGQAYLASARAGLDQGRPLLAANHHGFDTHPEMVQAILLKALAGRPEFSGGSASARAAGGGEPLLVLACSSVPLRNPTGSGGFLLGRRSAEGRRQRVMAFPRAWDECLTGLVPALTRAQVDNFRLRLARPPFNRAETRTAQALLDRAVEADFFDRPDFLSQAAAFNHRLWSSLTAGAGPAVLYVELEAVVGACLEHDLADDWSPVRRLLGQSGPRERVLTTLAGRTGCWSPELIGGRLARSALADTSRPLGTVFFWEISPSGRRYPMQYENSGGRPRLSGPARSLPLEPRAISQALADKLIRPGLLLDYLILADHGLDTRGGLFLVDYLRALLEPLAEILERPALAEYPERAGWLAAGALPLRAPNTEDRPAWQREVAAGALELAAGGPWTAEDWRRLAALTLGEIWPFTASEWYLEECRPDRRPPHWPGQLELMRARGRGLNRDPKVMEQFRSNPAEQFEHRHN